MTLLMIQLKIGLFAGSVNCNEGCKRTITDFTCMHTNISKKYASNAQIEQINRLTGNVNFFLKLCTAVFQTERINETGHRTTLSFSQAEK